MIVTLYFSGCRARVAAQDCKLCQSGPKCGWGIIGFADHACSTSANDDNLLPAILEQFFGRHGRDVSSGRIQYAMNGWLHSGEEQLLEDGESGEVYVDGQADEREGEMNFSIFAPCGFAILNINGCF